MEGVLGSISRRRVLCFLLQWAVLTCGHCFCNECTSIIIEQYSVGSHRSSIKCAICRQTTSHKEISYVFTSEKASQEEDIPVKVTLVTNMQKRSRSSQEVKVRTRLGMCGNHSCLAVDTLPESLPFPVSPSCGRSTRIRSPSQLAVVLPTVAEKELLRIPVPSYFL